MSTNPGNTMTCEEAKDVSPLYINNDPGLTQEHMVVNSKGFRYRFFSKGHRWEAAVDWPEDLDWTNGLKPIKP